MNDVERIDEYTAGLLSEAYRAANDTVDATHAPNSLSDWPSEGAIEFRDVRLQYESAAVPVFSSLTFSIPPRTRVGVVGRTGAGKSSLAVALFRVVELSGGSICIDGVDTRQLPLQRLRSSLSIIQQEPTLFQGTLRYNLAPVSEYSDAELLKALSLAGLETKVASLPAGLDSDVAEGGSNLSAGERQLLCMARAMLRRSACPYSHMSKSSLDGAVC